MTILFRHSILIICHFSHFSFLTLFLNVSWYRLLAITVPSDFTPIDVHCFSFSFEAFCGKIDQLKNCWQRPGQQSFKTFSQTSLFWTFSDAKVKFSGSQVLVKNGKKSLFTLTNFSFWSILKSPQLTTYVSNRMSRAVVLI